MYYPVGWSKSITINLKSKYSNDGENSSQKDSILELSFNSDKSLVLILTELSVRVWFSKPCVEIVSHSRTEESIKSLGYNLKCDWRPDSSMIVVQTTMDFLLFYKLGMKSTSDELFKQTDSNVSGFKRESAEFFIKEKIPSLFLVFSFSVKINPGISRIMSAEEEVVIGTKTSEIIGVNWDGSLDYNFSFKIFELLPFATTETDYYIVDIKYSSMFGGFSIVFANGRSGFMPLTTQSDPNSTEQKYCPTRIQFVPDTDNCVCTAVNHKYQLLAFGLRNSECLLCYIDDLNSSVVINHRLILSPSSFPTVSSTAGALTCLEWSPDSNVIATSWEKGGFALWSVFGALLTCSLSWDYGLLDNSLTNKIFTSFSWSREGYQLWMTVKNKNSEPDTVSTLSFVKSMFCANPSSICCSGEDVLLIGEDRLYLGVGANVFQQHQINGFTESDLTIDNLPTTNSNCTLSWEQQPAEIGNHQWIIIQMPSSYLANNWPIRFSAIDENGRFIAIAGQFGIAHYTLSNRRWKLFGNESQERDFEVRGGLLWWGDNIVVSCVNLMCLRFEIRIYPQKKKLDNQFSKKVELSSEVHLMSLMENRLLVLLLDGTFLLYEFHQKVSSSSPNSAFQLVRKRQIIVENLDDPPECVTSIVLSSLHNEPLVKSSNDSILLNVCGRLFLLEKKIDSVGGENNSGNLSEKSVVIYRAVAKLASGVENIWISRKNHLNDRPHLTNALWLSCGKNGMGVWLPLLPSEDEKQFPSSRSHNFISKRIMLPINTHIYPLAVLFRDAVVLGAENDTIFLGKNCPINTPFCVLSRTSQVYLHHLLRGLLRQNLGMHAWEIAKTCINLPYFPHSLELLLHEVLEEEATSSQPIPDALLPRIIDFIREFPFFLETVVHCARKTELALWPHLFAVVGDPRDLFQKCLDESRLETAASFIIILQNLEKSSVSRQYTLKLLENAKSSRRWELANDLDRFINAIDNAEVEAASNKSSSFPLNYISSSLSTPLTGEGDHMNHINSNQTGRRRAQSSGSSLMLHSPNTSSPMSASSSNSSPLSSLSDSFANNVVMKSETNELNHNKQCYKYINNAFS